MRSPFWLVLVVVGVAASVWADQVPDGVHLTWRFNTSAGAVETGTWNVTFNVSRNPNCSDITYSSTRNLTSTAAGDFDAYLYGGPDNFTPATHLCVWRNQSFLYGVFNLTRFPRNTSASLIMDDADLNLSGHNVSANTSFMVAGRVQSWLAPLADADVDLGNASTRWRDLYVSRNLTDATDGVTIHNLSAGLGRVFALTHLRNFTNDQNYTRNQSPVNLSPYYLEASALYVDNDTALQSVLWFRTFGVTRGSWFWNNLTGTYSLGTYTETGAWNGYAWWLNQTTKRMRVYGDLTGGGNLTANATVSAPNASFTALEGNLSCSNVTGAAGNLCLVAPTANPFNQSLNTSELVTFGGVNATNVTATTVNATNLTFTNGGGTYAIYTNASGCGIHLVNNTAQISFCP